MNKKKIDLSDVTFVIPIKIDSIERLENIQLVLNFIDKNFDTNISVLEAGQYNNKILKKILPKTVNILFEEDFDPIFHRTYYINELVKSTITPIVSVWDSDVIVSKTNILESVNILRENQADFVSPYDGNFLDTSEIIRELYIKHKKISILENNKGKMKPLYGLDAVGGGFFAHREAYITSGLENEKFYGWGQEDGERVNRWEILGYRYIRIHGTMYHLSHPRNINSRFYSKNQSEFHQFEVERMALMSEEEIIKEIKKWK